MAFIPKDARWYVADIVLEYQIEGDPRNVVHVNTHLIEAASPDEAYDKSIALGRTAETTFENTAGKEVRVLFRGIGELNVIHEALEDGAELMYSQFVGIPEQEVQEMVSPKGALGVYAPVESKASGPNYMSQRVMKMLEAKGIKREDLES